MPFKAGEVVLRDMIGRPPYAGPDSVRYVSPNGDDSFDGLSWDTPKKTILAAYDSLPGTGGTIYIADGSWVGGEVPNQGIWLIGPSDPSYASPPAGWRVQRARVRFIGIGVGFSPSLPIQFARPGAATVVGGGPLDVTQGWVRDNLKPCIWLAGTSEPVWFENLNFFFPQVGVRLGIASDNSNRRTLTALADFSNVNLFAPADLGTDNGAGPLVDAGYSFWITWRRCSLLAYASAPQGEERRSAMLLKNDDGYDAPGLWIVDDCRFAGGGGIRYHVEGLGTWGNVYVRDTVLESDGIVPSDPVFWISTLPGSAQNPCFLSNLATADGGPGSSPCVRIAVGLPANTVTAINTEAVDGPATLLGTSYPAGGKAMGAHRQVGLTASGIHGPTQIRAFGGPTTSRFTPMALSGYPPSSSGTITVAPTDGPTGLPAYRLTTSSAPGVRDSWLLAFLAHLVPAVGDLWVMGVWVRAPNGVFLGDAPGVVLGFNDTTGKFDDGSFYKDLLGVTSWQWVTVAAKVASTTGGFADMNLKAWLYAGYPIDVLQPVVYFLPAGTYNESDAMEWAQYIAPVPSGSTPGNAVLLAGQNMEFGGAPGGFGGYQMGYGGAAPTTGTWAAGSIVFNNAPSIGAPKGWVCTAGGSPGTWTSMGNL